MPKPTRLPRIYVVRHGETEWSISGQHTGLTDIPLTSNGEETIRSLGRRIVGPGRVLDPTHLKHAFVSPRQRAQKTFQLLFEGSATGVPEHSLEEQVREWEYGVCEGKKTHEIRNEVGSDWDIWTMGCPGGESPEEMTKRCDDMIKKIVDLTSAHHGEEDSPGHGDVLIVSHGHFSRCFLTRWAGLNLSQGRIFVADAGAMSICGFQHRNFDERSLLGLNLFGSIEQE
ncbi:hypothetical protein JCM10212_002494 [Sporobolomyces blumeae]